MHTGITDITELAVESGPANRLLVLGGASLIISKADSETFGRVLR